MKLAGYEADIVNVTVGILRHSQGDYLSGKPGNVREFETCQGNVRDYVNSQGIVREKSCQGKVSQNCSLLVEYLHSTPFFLLALLADFGGHSYFTMRSVQWAFE